MDLLLPSVFVLLYVVCVSLMNVHVYTYQNIFSVLVIVIYWIADTEHLAPLTHFSSREQWKYCTQLNVLLFVLIYMYKYMYQINSSFF